MSQAEELLKSLSAAEMPTISVEPVNDILLIDPETRTIHVPESELLFGVKGDKNVERKYFKCPRIVGDNIDLSKLGIRIPYQTSDGYEDEYPVDDLKVVGNYITFSWLLNGNIFTNNGTINFAICAVKVDSEGYETNVWNTFPAIGNILAGLPHVGLNSGEEAQARDVLQQLLNMLNTKSEEAVQNVENTTDEQIAAVEEKGTEVLASIPEDYTTTYNRAEEAVRTKGDAIVLEASGEVITVDDSSEDPVRGLKIFGKSEQTSTNGDQLIPYPYNGLTNNSDGEVTWVVNDDMTISVSGTPTAQRYYALVLQYTLPVGTYTLSGCPSNGQYQKYWMYIERKSDGYVWYETGNGVTFEVTEEGTYDIVANVGAIAGTVSNLTFCPILNIGSEIKSFEPYSGGYASPSPEWTQEITSLCRKSRNVLPNNVEFKTVNGIHFEVDKYGRVIANGTSSSASTEYIDINRNGEILEAGEYIARGCPVGGSATTYRMYVYKNVDGSNILIGSIFNGSLKFTLDEDCNVWVRTAIEAGVTVKDLMFEPMIYKSSEKVLEFEPYTDKHIIGIKNIGKNYLKVTAVSQTVDGVTFTVNDDGSIIANGTATANIYFAVSKFNLRDGDYKFSGCTGGTTSTYLLYFQKTDGTGYVHIINDDKTFTISNGDDEERRILIAVYKGTTVSNAVFYPMISVEGGEFEPYKESLEWLLLDEPLRAIPVSSGGNYTDSNGQQWIADYIDLERGAVVQMVGKVIFDGSDDEGWYAPKTVDETYRCCTTVLNDISIKHAVGDIANILCDQFTAISAVYTFAEEKKTGIAVQGAGNPAVFVYHEDYNTSDISIWVEHLMESPMTVFYELANPVITPLTTEDVKSLKALHTHCPNTIVFNSEDAFMKLNYNADTKTYINQNDVESKPVNHMLLTDTATGKIYKVTVTNGQLNIVESIN